MAMGIFYRIWLEYDKNLVRWLVSCNHLLTQVGGAILIAGSEQLNNCKRKKLYYH